MRKFILLLSFMAFTFSVFAQEKIYWATILPYENGVAQASRTESYSGGEGEWGLVDEQGNTILEPTYKLMRPWREGLSKVLSMDGWFGFIDMTGKVVIPLKYIPNCDFYYGFYNSFAAIRTYNGWGFINKKGEEVIPPNYSYVKLFNKQGYAVVYENMYWGTYCKPEITDKTKYAVIDTLGNEIIKMGKYDGISDDDGNGNFIVKQKNSEKYGVIDINDNVIVPIIYDRINGWGQYYIVVQKSKYGILDINGNQQVSLKYDYIKGLHYGNKISFYVFQNESSGLINENGEMLTMKKYETIGDYKNDGNYTNNDCGANSMARWNRAMAKYNGKWGWVNIDGEEVISCQYDNVNQYDFRFSKTGIIAVAKKGSDRYKWGVIDTNGKIILPLIYDYVIIDKNDEEIQVSLNGREFVVDRNGKKIRDR